MGKRRKSTHAYRGFSSRAGWALAVGFVLLLVANLLVMGAESREGLGRDVTPGRLYSLSETSQTVLDLLEKPVELFHYAADTPEDAMVQQLLQRYAAQSDKVILTEVSTENLATLSERFLSAEEELARGSLLVAEPEGDRYRLLSTGEMILYDEDYRATITKAEAKISSAIRYIDTGLSMHIYFLSGHGETPMNAFPSLLGQLDNLNYDVGSINLSSSARTLSPNTDILLVVSPKFDLPQAEYERVREFLDKGGRAIFFMDRFIFGSQGLVSYDNPQPNFEQLLSYYNMRVSKDVVVGGDPSYIGLRATTFSVNPQKHAITNSIIKESLPTVLSDVSSIVLTGQYVDAHATPLLMTTESCYTKVLDENFLNLKRRGDDATGSFAVGAYAERGESRVVLFGTSSFIENKNLSITGNLALITQTLDELGPQDLGLNMAAKPLVLSVADGSMQTLLYTLVGIALPLIILGLGVLVYLRRKRL